MLIKDLSSSDDKIDLRAFKKSGSSLTITDIEDASSIYDGGTTTGVKIDLSGWTKETETYGGSIIIEAASLDNDGHIKLADMTLLTNTNFFIETLENNDGGG